MHGSGTPTSAQTSFVSVCTLAIAPGSVMSGQNFPAESFLHPLTPYLLQIVLDGRGIAFRDFIGIHIELFTSAALPQQIPKLV
jgi:hypothetical protein